MLGAPLAFSDLPGWEDDDHAAALAVFRRSAEYLLGNPVKTRALGVSGDALRAIAQDFFADNLATEAVLGSGSGRVAARNFFETHFVPRLIFPQAVAGVSERSPDRGPMRGFVTGYYEPEVAGSLQKSARFATPLLRRPQDLVEIADLPPEVVPFGWDPELRFGRFGTQGLEPYHDRAAIMAGVLNAQDLDLVYLEDPIDAFFIHIQGSARICLEQGGVMRVTYAAKTGHPYTPVGRILIERGHVRREDMSMAAIRAWFEANRGEQDAIMAHNRSYIFFEEVVGLSDGDGPIGAAKVPLSARRSLAVDRILHTLGTPIFLDAALPNAFRHLMIAQDTGSAIVGPARGDIYFGSGRAAAHAAGGVQNAADFYLLWPKHQPI